MQALPSAASEPTSGQHNGTEVSADWLNGIQDEIARTIEDLSGTLDKANNDQLKALLEPLVKGILAAASDTGTISTTLSRALVAAVTSGATGPESAVLASKNVELHDDNSIGGFSGSGIGPNGTNQNLAWKNNSVVGNARFKGFLWVGGDPDTNTG